MMREEEMQDFMHKFKYAFEKGPLSSEDRKELFHTDYNVWANTEYFLDFIQYDGRDSQNAYTAFDPIKVTIHPVLSDNTSFFADVRVKGRHTGVFFGIPPTNQEISYRGFAYYRLKNGKISNAEIIWTWLQVLQQLNKALLNEEDEEKMTRYLKYLNKIGLVGK